MALTRSDVVCDVDITVWSKLSCSNVGEEILPMRRSNTLRLAMLGQYFTLQWYEQTPLRGITRNTNQPSTPISVA